MPTTTILLLLLAFVVSAGLSAFQYLYKTKERRLQNALFGTLRFITLFSLLVLLINPQLKKVEYFSEKPELVLAVDNSSSIAGFGEVERVQEFVRSIAQDENIRERFDVEVFTFGRNLEQRDTFTFNEPQTNIPAALKGLDDLYEQKTAPTILITDGNQTLGEDLLFSAQKFKQPLLPVVVGDTTLYQDLAISRVNTNKYAFVNNWFPVEVLVNYTGKTKVTSQLRIRSGNVTLFSENLTFDEDENSHVIEAKLPSVSVGVNSYDVQLRPLPDEKNVLNNSKEFVVEVIDERTSVAIVYNILHPDVGALKKAIVSNQQREVVVEQINDFNRSLDDFQLIILYQPDRSFKRLMDQLEEEERNQWIITGPETNWRFLNTQQEFVQHEITGQPEEYFPVLNENFGAFQTEDIGYSSFPPLKGNFGELEFSENIEILLYRKIQGIESKAPLLAVAEQAASKKAFLLGADLWKWRSQVYQDNASFEVFDALIDKLVQYLSSGKRKERLSVSYEPLYHGSGELVLTAEYFDKNYIFDPRGELILRLTEKGTGKEREVPFMLNGGNYKVDLSNLSPGEYNFTAAVSGENLSERGSFRILEFDVEEQFSRANLEILQKISTNNNQDLYFLGDIDKIKKNILSNDSYTTIQKSRENNVPLIDWYYLLGIIVLALSAEWFLRKYYGYI
mgnify:CR=1 FL=1